MANKVLLKKSSIAAKIPLTSDLDYGELALNYTDGKLYFKNASNVIKNFIQSDLVTLDSVTDVGATTTNVLSVGGLTVNSVYSLPTVDGSSNQYLKTDGSGALSWASVSGSGSVASDLSITTNTFTGNGSTVAFTLSAAPASDGYIFVTINGVNQDISSYSLSGTTLTLTEAPATGDLIETRTISGLSAAITTRNYSKYIYNITGTTSTITGADYTGNILAYDVGAVDVYHNGIRLVEGDDYTAANGTSVVLTQAALNTDTVEVLSYGRAYIADGWVPISTALTTTAANQIIDTFLVSNYSTAKYFCQVKQSSSIHSTEINIMHDGTNVYITEYGTMYSGVSLGTFTANIVSGSLRLLFTPINNNTTIKSRRVLIGS